MKHSYIETVQTPHKQITQRDGLIDRHVLHGSRELRTIKAEFQSSDMYFDDMVEAARAVGGVVRRTLRFKVREKDDAAIDPSNLAETNNTNCHGYTIINSECLSEINVPHFVGFANGHSFIMMLGVENQEVFLLDTSTREFYTDVTNAITSTPLDQFCRGEDFSENTLDTTGLIHIMQNRKNKNSEEYPWLTHNKPHRVWNMSQSEIDHGNMIQLRLYPPNIGRDVIEAYARLSAHVDRDELDEATIELMRMQGLYPEMDQRNNGGYARKLITKLIAAKRFDDAELAVGVLELSRRREDLTGYYVGDTLRAIGRAAGGQEDYFQRAIDWYSDDESSGVLTRQKIYAARDRR